MIANLTEVQTFESVARNMVLGLRRGAVPRKVMESAFEKFLIVKSQKARVWLGVLNLMEEVAP
jgi:hypothetical protein